MGGSDAKAELTFAEEPHAEAAAVALVGRTRRAGGTALVFDGASPAVALRGVRNSCRARLRCGGRGSCWRAIAFVAIAGGLDHRLMLRERTAACSTSHRIAEHERPERHDSKHRTKHNAQFAVRRRFCEERGAQLSVSPSPGSQLPEQQRLPSLVAPGVPAAQR